MAIYVANNGQLQTIKGIYKGLGKNLLTPSGINYGSYVVQGETFMGNRVVKLIPYGWQTIYFTVTDIVPDNDYTFSIYTRCTNTDTPYFSFRVCEYDNNNTEKIIYQTPSNVFSRFIKGPNWYRFTYTFRVSSTAVKVVITYGNHGWNNNDINVYASTPKVEEGTVATEWVPAQGTNTPY